MTFDNLTLKDTQTVEVNRLGLDILQESAISAPSTVVQISLASLSFGALTILDLACIYCFISRGSIAQTNGRILLLSTILLYMSTATYMAALIWAWLDRHIFLSKAWEGLFSVSYDGQEAIAALKRSIHKQSLMISLALGANLVVGDAIVWWRACVIWQHKAVTSIGLLLLSLTTISGAIGMAKAPGPQTTTLTFLFQGIYGQISGLLSLCTNVVATSLTAYKAWKHRQLMKRHFAASGATSQVLKAFALLIESGCVYCVIVVFAIIYQEDPTPSQDGARPVFGMVDTDFAYGCAVPLVAMYPTIIIVIVALKRSPIDTAGLSRVRQAHGGHEESGTVEGGVSSTIVFQHESRLHSSASADTESATSGMPPGGPAFGHFEMSMNKAGTRGVETLGQIV